MLGIQLKQREYLEDNSSRAVVPTRPPTPQELLDYARELQVELDGFIMGKAYHCVHINQSEGFIECVVEITKEDKAIPITLYNIKNVHSAISESLANINGGLREQVIQSIHDQCGYLRLYDGPWIFIYKAPRLTDWTKTQAVVDAGDIIRETVSCLFEHEEGKYECGCSNEDGE